MGAFKVRRASVIDLYAWFAHTAVVSCRRLITQEMFGLIIDFIGEIKSSCQSFHVNVHVWTFTEQSAFRLWTTSNEIWILFKQSRMFELLFNHCFNGNILSHFTLMDKLDFCFSSYKGQTWTLAQAISCQGDFCGSENSENHIFYL